MKSKTYQHHNALYVSHTDTSTCFANTLEVNKKHKLLAIVKSTTNNNLVFSLHMQYNCGRLVSKSVMTRHCIHMSIPDASFILSQ